MCRDAGFTMTSNHTEDAEWKLCYEFGALKRSKTGSGNSSYVVVCFSVSSTLTLFYSFQVTCFYSPHDHVSIIGSRVTDSRSLENMTIVYMKSSHES